MFSDRFQRDRLLIFTHYCQKNSSVLHRLQGLLKIYVGFPEVMMPSQYKILPANIADNASPQRIIQIENDKFSGKPEHPAQGRFDIPDGSLEYLIAKYDFAQIP